MALRSMAYLMKSRPRAAGFIGCRLSSSLLCTRMPDICHEEKGVTSRDSVVKTQTVGRVLPMKQHSGLWQ